MPVPTIKPGNTLFLSKHPQPLNAFDVATLAHEAVHIHCDLDGKKKKALDNEAMGIFVWSYLLARLAPKEAKRATRGDDELLLGCIASDFLDANPNIKTISTKQFDKGMNFDYRKEGGVIGTVNPYQAFINCAVVRGYRRDFKASKVTHFDFDGIPEAA